MSHQDYHISIEVKFRSSVTDQFKARSFDAFHLKKEYGKKILTILVYVKAERGLSIQKANEISHWFDVFYSYQFSQIETEWGISELIQAIENFERKGLLSSADH